MKPGMKPKIQVYVPTRILRKFDRAWRRNNATSRSSTVQELMIAYVEHTNAKEAALEVLSRGTGEDGLLDQP